MSILVNTNNETEERLLIAFLNSHRYNYKSEVVREDKKEIEAFLDQYNHDIAKAEAEIDSENYVSHEEVEKIFSARRKA